MHFFCFLALHRTLNLHTPPYVSFVPALTFVRHHFTGLEEHLGAAGHADLVDVVAELVAAVLPAAEAQALVEGLFGVAAVGHALLLRVQQGVNEQVDGALVGTFDELVHICKHTCTQRAREL